MYKSIVALLCAMILVVSFSACSNQSDSKSPAEKSATESISSENYENAENLVTTKKAEQPIEKAEITSAEACSKISEMDIEKLGLKGKKEDYKFMVASEGRNIEEYMIDQNLLMLDNEHIFVDVTTQKAYLVCLPIKNYNNNITITGFLKNILFSLKYDQSENTNYVTEILSYLNSNSNLSLLDLKKLLFNILQSDDNPLIKKNEETVKPENQLNLSQNKLFNHEEKRAFNMQKTSGNMNQENFDSLHEYTDSRIKSDKAKNEDENTKDKAAVQNTNDEKKMSFFRLLTNFSKENLELYKTQHENKGTVKQIQKKDKQYNHDTSFSIPGQSGFNIPGKKDNADEMKNESQTEKVSYTEIERKESGKEPYAFNVTGGNLDFGSTVYFDEGSLNSTVMIGENDTADKRVKQIVPKLRRVRTDTEVIIDKNPLKIGKQQDYVDYCIADNPAISGCHAFIYSQGNEFFIKDMSSTNHVYINGKMIESNKLIPIRNADIIKLANEDFEFSL